MEKHPSPFSVGTHDCMASFISSALPADAVASIIAYCSPLDLLALAPTCKGLHAVCNDLLARMSAVDVAGTTITAKTLAWLLKERTAAVHSLDVSGCAQISKRDLLRSVRGCNTLSSLSVRSLGVGSWAIPALHKLLVSAPSQLLLQGNIECDARVVLNQDVGPGLVALFAHPALCVRRIVAIRRVDLRPTSGGGGGGGGASALALAANAADPVVVANGGGSASAAATGAAAAIAAAALAGGSAAATAALQSGAAAGAAGLGPPHAAALPAPGDPLEQLANVLLDRGDLWELDGSSGSLGQYRGVERFVAPILRAEGCALRLLACSDISRAGVAALTDALAVNHSLRSLKLGCNTIDTSSAGMLAAALAGHPTLTTLTLEHNPILESGAAAIAHTLRHNAITTLSMAFTGAGDDACEAVAAAVAARAALTDVSLCGNGVGSRGVVALAEAIETAGPSGHLRALNLSANCSPDAGRRITPDAIVRLAAALPCGVLRRLDLAGCNVSAHAVGMLAASLPRCALAALDLSSNHFGCEGAWSLAWAIADAPSLRTLNLSDCAIGDDGGEELADALCTPVAAASIQSIDLRGNKLAKDHRLGDDQRVGMGFQRPAAAAAAAEPEEAS